MLEECELAYDLRIIDITAGEQNVPEFAAISPNRRIPAIVDPEGPGGQSLALFESGAILLYLANKTGCFLPREEPERWTVVQWLMFQMGGVGPMFGQAFHYLHQHPADASAEDIEQGRTRYRFEALRLCRVMDDRLAVSEYLGGTDYSIADMAVFPWIALHRWLDLELSSLPHLSRWYNEIRARPGVRRGMDVPSERQLTEHTRSRKGTMND